MLLVKTTSFINRIICTRLMSLQAIGGIIAQKQRKTNAESYTHTHINIIIHKHLKKQIPIITLSIRICTNKPVANDTTKQLLVPALRVKRNTHASTQRTLEQLVTLHFAKIGSATTKFADALQYIKKSSQMTPSDHSAHSCQFGWPSATRDNIIHGHNDLHK